MLQFILFALGAYALLVVGTFLQFLYIAIADIRASIYADEAAPIGLRSDTDRAHFQGLKGR